MDDKSPGIVSDPAHSQVIPAPLRIRKMKRSPSMIFSTEMTAHEESDLVTSKPLPASPAKPVVPPKDKEYTLSSSSSHSSTQNMALVNGQRVFSAPLNNNVDSSLKDLSETLDKAFNIGDSPNISLEFAQESQPSESKESMDKSGQKNNGEKDLSNTYDNTSAGDVECDIGDEADGFGVAHDLNSARFFEDSRSISSSAEEGDVTASRNLPISNARTGLNASEPQSQVEDLNRQLLVSLDEVDKITQPAVSFEQWLPESLATDLPTRELDRISEEASYNTEELLELSDDESCPVKATERIDQGLAELDHQPEDELSIEVDVESLAFETSCFESSMIDGDSGDKQAGKTLDIAEENMITAAGHAVFHPKHASLPSQNAEFHHGNHLNSGHQESTGRLTDDFRRSRSTFTSSEGASAVSPSSTRSLLRSSSLIKKFEFKSKTNRSPQSPQSPRTPKIYGAGRDFLFIPPYIDVGSFSQTPESNKDSQSPQSRRVSTSELSALSPGKSSDSKEITRRTPSYKRKFGVRTLFNSNETAEQPAIISSPLPTPNSANSSRSWRKNLLGRSRRLSLPREFRDGKRSSTGSDVVPRYTNEKLIQKIEYVRRIVRTHYPLNPKAETQAPTSTLDAHTWKTKSLRCVSCKGDCPLCGNTCCIYQIARHVILNTDANDKAADQARKVIEIVEDLGISACEPCTFSMCSLGGGCGKYVCFDCCGTCPVCQDIQCKECKENPKGICDWHDEDDLVNATNIAERGW